MKTKVKALESFTYAKYGYQPVFVNKGSEVELPSDLIRGLVIEKKVKVIEADKPVPKTESKATPKAAAKKEEK